MIYAKIQDKKYAAYGQIVDFLMDNVSNLSSARNITNTLGSMQRRYTIRRLAIICNTCAMHSRSTRLGDMILREKVFIEQRQILFE